MLRRLSLVFAGAVLFASPASGQTFEEALEEAQTAGPGVFQEPDFLVTKREALRPRWSVNAVYGDWVGEGGDRVRHWLIRRAVGDQTGQTQLVWADSRTCPGVRAVLAAMEDMDPPRPQVFGLTGEPDRIVAVGDGATVTFRSRWASAGADGALLQMELTGNVNTPHAIWWAESVEALRDCWTASDPR